MSFIILRDLVKVFSDPKRGRETLTLDHVSLDIAKGEFLCLLGPSGCGKSTILNMIAGFEGITSGLLTVDGKAVYGPGAERGMVFQSPTLMPWLPVFENVAFYLKLQGKGREERRRLAQPFINMVGLTGFENHFPGELSGGMASRVGIARALLLNPAVILMDEPFGALDAQTKTDMQEELAAIWERAKCTIVFVTHSVEEALILGDKVAVMTARPGRIRELLAVDLPRPRDTTSVAFNEYKRDVLAMVREEAARAKQDLRPVAQVA
jgi:NitT/TauT family transport system ATP-binding protein